MNDQDRNAVLGKILPVIRRVPKDTDGWVDLAPLGKQLNGEGIRYKEMGFLKLRPFLESFQDELEFREERDPGKPPVVYVRLKGGIPAPGGNVVPKQRPAGNAAPFTKPNAAFGGGNITVGEKYPTEDTWLFSWAGISDGTIKELSELALEEKWYYGDPPKEGEEPFPILRNYLAYTFKRLVYEKKIKYAVGKEWNMEYEKDVDVEYAAFNTGLVDKKYEDIYALFKQNSTFSKQNWKPYWYLCDFVVSGEGRGGKTLVSLFNPKPERANYFENKIENMLYDTSTGYLDYDKEHILTERTYRLPIEFLKNNCPLDFLSVDGVGIDEMYNRQRDEIKEEYFRKLGNKIRENSMILHRLKMGMEMAVDVAKKRVQWNYKTAIPTYSPKKKRCALLLPLALVNENHVDLALVVERQDSGAYQGQTVLPLDLAYSNSRLVTRPDSDWLKTDIISTEGDSDPGDAD